MGRHGKRRRGLLLLLMLVAFLIGFYLTFQVTYRFLLILDYTDSLPYTRKKWGLIGYIARDAVEVSLGIMLVLSGTAYFFLKSK